MNDAHDNAIDDKHVLAKLTDQDAARKLAERMAGPLRCLSGEAKVHLDCIAAHEKIVTRLRPYAAAMVQAEEALDSAEGGLGNWDALKHDHDDGRNYGDCPRCSWDNAHAETVAALAALRALEAK